MRAAFTLALVGALLAPLVAVAAPNDEYLFEHPPKRVALVIGNGTYQTADPLPGSIEDARTMTKTLTDLGFTITPVMDVKTRADFLNLYFIPFLNQIEEGSIVAFYFSGHGFTYDGESYLAPTSFPDRVHYTDIFQTFLSASAIQDQINGRKPSILLMLLDACRDIGSFEAKIDQGGKSSGDVKKGLAQLRTSQDDIVGFSSESGKPSVGKSLGLSPYTAAVAQHIKQSDVDFDRIEKDIVFQVREVTGNQQSPWFSSSNTVILYLNPSPKISSQVKEQWRASLNTGTVDEVKRFIAFYGASPYSAAARKWLRDNETNAKPATVSPIAPEIGWDKLSAQHSTQDIFASAVAGPFALERHVSFRDATAVSDIGHFPSSKVASSWDVAKELSGSGETVLLKNLPARSGPTDNAPLVADFGSGTNLSVDGYNYDSLSDTVWLKARHPKSNTPLYLKIPEDARITPVNIGSPEIEVTAASRPEGLITLVDEHPIAEALAILKSREKEISWVSIATPKAATIRENNILGARASSAAFILSSHGVPSDRISTVEQLDFKGNDVRLRFFAKSSKRHR